MNIVKLMTRIRRVVFPAFHRIPQPSEPSARFRKERAMIGSAACLLFSAMSLFAQGEQVFKGQVCLGPEGRTPVMRDGHAALPCTIKHPKRGAKYVLFNPETNVSYPLDGRLNSKTFAGRNVVILGTLDPTTGTIHIDDLFRGLSPKIEQAKSVYIDCDACPRGMAAAWSAAFQELSDWGKYEINPDPKKADLIFIFAANPYLGDYVTRDGPDTRGVSVDIT